jgi:hypothetical protein
MSDEKFSTISPGKAIISFILDIALFVVAPFLLRDWLNANYPTYAAYFTDEIFDMIVTLGVFSAITTFFKNLWKPGTRPHGFFNVIYAGYHLYYIMFLFGGIETIGTEGFGVIAINILDYAISINLMFLAYAFLIQSGITVLLYIIEMIV